MRSLHHSEEPKLNKPLSGENLSGMVFFIVKFDIVKFQNWYITKSHIINLNMICDAFGGMIYTCPRERSYTS